MFTILHMAIKTVLVPRLVRTIGTLQIPDFGPFEMNRYEMVGKESWTLGLIQTSNLRAFVLINGPDGALERFGIHMDCFNMVVEIGI